MKLDGRDYETADLKVSFLAVDLHRLATTPASPWSGSNRITLKSREYIDARPGTPEAGDGERMVEIRTAPPAVPIRYTTDGSDPAVAGGAYGEPFAVPEGARLILAVAGKDGIASEVHRARSPTSPSRGPSTGPGRRCGRRSPASSSRPPAPLTASSPA